MRGKILACSIVVLLMIVSFSGIVVANDNAEKTDQILPLDGTMELWQLEKTIIEAKLIQSQSVYQNNDIDPSLASVPPDKIKFKLWCGGTNYKDINITKRAESTHAYIYIKEGLTVDDNLINNAKAYIDAAYPREANYIANPETKSADGYDKIIIVIADITHAAGYFSAAWETGAYGPIYGDNGKLDCFVVQNKADSLTSGKWGTIAHELAHMLSYKFGNGFKDIWLEEGLAEYGCYIGENGLVNSHKTRIGYYEKAPYKYSVIWAVPGANSEEKNALYGTAFLYVYYISEHYGGQNTIKKIVTRDGTNFDGITLIDKVLQPYNKNFESVFRDWVIANYIDDTSLEDGKYGYYNIDIHAMIKDTISQDNCISDTVISWSADYIEINQWRIWPVQKYKNIDISFAGIDTQTNFAPRLVLTKGSNHQIQPINLNPDKDGSIYITDADTYDRITLIVPNAGSTGVANDYLVGSMHFDDNYDVKYWFNPGTGADTSDSDPEESYTCIRNWVDHLCMQYWNKLHSAEISNLETGNLDIWTENTSYTVGETITFHMIIANRQDVEKTVSYIINLESKDPDSESAARDVQQTLTGDLILPPNSTAVYNVDGMVPNTLRFDRVIYAVAEVDGEKAVTTFRTRPSYDLNLGYDLIEKEPSIVNLTIKNNGSVPIANISITLDTFDNIEVLEPIQLLGELQAGETNVFIWDVFPVSSGFTMLTFNISTSASGSGKISTLAQITAKPKLLVEADSMRINPGDQATITASITNSGDISLDNVTAQLRHEDGLFTSNPLTQTIGSLDGRTTEQVSWNITGSDFGSYLYSVYAEDGAINATDIETITIIEEGHSVVLKIDGLDDISQKYTFIKTPVDYTIDITNTGTSEDTIDVYVFPQGTNWTTILYDSGTQTTTSPHRVTVPAGSTHQLNLRLTPYQQVDIGEEFNVDIRIVSEKDTSRYDVGIARAVVVSESQPILTVIPSVVSRTINHDSQETFTITIKNDGLSDMNNVQLLPSGTIAPWIALSQDNITSISPGGSVEINVTISVPRYQAPNVYEGEINIESENGGTASVQISVDVPASYEVISSVTPAYNSAVPGDTASYTVSVKNEGNVVDRYAPVIENSTSTEDGNISNSWVSASKINITLNPGITDTLTLDIMPPRRWSTMPGMYNFVVNVSSQNTFDTNDATLEVLNFSDVSIEITGAQAVNPPVNPIDPDLERIIKENPSGKVKVIIKTKGKPGSAESAEIEKEGGDVKYTYRLINGIAAVVPAKNVDKIASKPFVESIELDKEVHALLDTSVPVLNVSAVYRYGQDGSGVDIAVLDTGIDHNHSAFTSIGWEYDFVDGDNYAEDLNGHGTHVAGIIASDDSTYKGVAPGATIMPVRVLDESGLGNSSDVIAGIEWAVDHGAEIISMSLGGTGGDGSSALSLAADSAVAKGVTVVVAAGNGGPSSGTITSPGDARNVITVGAVNDTGTIADFSSRGQTTDGCTKPDIVAPGVGITSTQLNGGFAPMSGTSMSTPHVAGAVALLIQTYQTNPQEIKEVITMTAKDLGYDNNTQGAGLIDVDASYLYLKELNKPIVQNVRPGGTAIYDTKLTNLGNIFDIFNVAMVPDYFDAQYCAYPTMIQNEWVTLNSSLVGYPGEVINDNANIYVPDNWAGMDDTIYTFKIQATSETDNSATDNVNGNLVINPTKRSMVEYTGLEIKWLSDDINSLLIADDLKISLLDKTTSASEKNDQAMNFLLNGKETLSNNMLGAEYGMLDALFNELEAQSGKGLSISDAEYLKSKAGSIKQHVNKAIITPI